MASIGTGELLILIATAVCGCAAPLTMVIGTIVWILRKKTPESETPPPSR